jgi:Malectin domain
LDAVLCIQRSFWGLPGAVGSYNIPITSGSYTVNLVFAETYFGEKEKQPFDVIVQEKQSLLHLT